MPMYRLRCAYRFSDGKRGPVYGTDVIEAVDNGSAIDIARSKIHLHNGMRLFSAVLTAVSSSGFWSMTLVDQDGRSDTGGDWLFPLEA